MDGLGETRYAPTAGLTMKLQVLGCYGGSYRGRHLSCYLLNDTIALDAGSLTHALSYDEQARVRHVIVSHSHLDHNCSLAFLIDNIFGVHDGPIEVYAIPPVVSSLRKHLFNDELWPDFTKLPSEAKPTLRFHEIQEEKPFTIEGLSFTPVRVNHITPTVGFVIDDGKSAIIYTGDTGPTDRVWEVANRTENLKAVITEASFPNEQSELATTSGHLTPESLGLELKKLEQRVKIYVTHLKPRWRAQIAKQVSEIHSPRIELLEQNKIYRF